jgi:hypothetical protein
VYFGRIFCSAGRSKKPGYPGFRFAPFFVLRTKNAQNPLGSGAPPIPCAGQTAARFDLAEFSLRENPRIHKAGIHAGQFDLAEFSLRENSGDCGLRAGRPYRTNAAAAKTVPGTQGWP